MVCRPIDGRPERDVAGRDARAVHDLRAVDHAHDRARDVVFAGGVEARHLRRLTAEQRRAVLAARARDARDHALDQARLDFSRRDVVEEEERLRALHQDVVDAVVDEVRPHGVVAAHLDGDLQLRPDAVRRAHEHGLLVLREVRQEQAAESPDVAEHARREGRADGGLGARERGGLRVDVDAGFGVAGLAQGRRL